MRSSLESSFGEGGDMCFAAICTPSVQEMITSFDRANIVEIDLLEAFFITVEDVASITNSNDAGVIIEGGGLRYSNDMIQRRRDEQRFETQHNFRSSSPQLFSFFL